MSNGAEYNKYFIKSTCTPTFLNYGDTAFTVSRMRKWAKKNKGQTRDLAIEKFSGMELSTTVSAIYGFLYGHIQYELDRTKQNIKSPACAWATRERGMDCKSYSVFASTILLNLGIVHYFRRVKQPGKDPDRWTHVYIVVPQDQISGKLGNRYHVLDATVHDNTEVDFLKKSDVFMERVSLPHYGLQAPLNGLAGCTCKEKTVQRPISTSTMVSNPSLVTGTLPEYKTIGLKAPASFEDARFQEALIRFKLFLRDLNLKGVPTSVTQQAMKRLQAHINSGKQPTLRDLLDPSNGLGITAPLLTSTNQLPSSSSYFTASGSRSGSSGILNTVASVVPFGTTATSLLSSLVPKDLFDKTFGAVFANGFNFKCWGASWNPTRAEQAFNEEAVRIQTKLDALLRTNIGQLESAINDFWVWFYGVRSTERDWLNTSAKDCTKDGLKILIGSLDGMAAQIKGIIQQSLEGAGHKIQSTTAIKRTYPPEDTGRHALTMDVPQYKVTLGSTQAPVATSQGRSNTTVSRVDLSGNNNTGTVQSTANNTRSNMYVDQNGKLQDGGTTGNAQGNTPQLAGFGGVTAIILASIAAGTYLYSKKSNKNSKV